MHTFEISFIFLFHANKLDSLIRDFAFNYTIKIYAQKQEKALIAFLENAHKTVNSIGFA